MSKFEGSTSEYISGLITRGMSGKAIVERLGVSSTLVKRVQSRLRGGEIRKFVETVKPKRRKGTR